MTSSYETNIAGGPIFLDAASSPSPLNIIEPPTETNDFNSFNNDHHNPYDPLTHSPNQLHLNALPISRSNHPLDKSILTHHIESIQHQIALGQINPDLPLTTIPGNSITSISLTSFLRLLKFNSPIDDSIFHGFLSLVHYSHKNIHCLDTNFSRDLFHLGWQHAFRKYFLHNFSSKYSHKTKIEPSIDSPDILIPIHIDGCRWVALNHRWINNITYFFYADDMNSPKTEDTIKHHFSTHSTSVEFNPHNSICVNCTNYTYHPHSNECGPRSLLALSIFGTHPSPTRNMFIPFMHPNIAQISRWWIAASLIRNVFDHAPLLDVIPTPNISTTSLHMESSPAQIVTLQSYPNIVPIVPPPSHHELLPTLNLHSTQTTFESDPLPIIPRQTSSEEPALGSSPPNEK